MDLGLLGKTAVITGGSKGIGFAIAEEFAREGVDLHLSARSGDDLRRAAADLTGRFGARVDIHPVDLSDRAARDAFARECAHVDILVNCAGAIPGGGLDQVGEDAWRAAWDLKLFGYVGITRIIYEEMCRRRRGVIINIVGVGGLMTNAGYICGGPSNAALINFTISLGGASVRHGVRVCGVNPGPVDTERMAYLRRIQEEGVPARERDEWRKRYFDKMAYGRGARSDEISGAVAFLASDRASYISGAMLTIDGGIVARAGAPGSLVEPESA
ncbi:MAG TPA: short-chain dehydrogenase/reductase [Xanthobacteraceae bacterium]|nr:short-chain dehydrogenase/reductase [Xanthobacteraceae bacterium]